MLRPTEQASTDLLFMDSAMKNCHEPLLGFFTKCSGNLNGGGCNHRVLYSMDVTHRNKKNAPPKRHHNNTFTKFCLHSYCTSQHVTYRIHTHPSGCSHTSGCAGPARAAWLSRTLTLMGAFTLSSNAGQSHAVLSAGLQQQKCCCSVPYWQEPLVCKGP